MKELNWKYLDTNINNIFYSKLMFFNIIFTKIISNLIKHKKLWFYVKYWNNQLVKSKIV